MYGTVWGLVMTNTIPRDVPFLKKLFITQYGDFGSNHIVDVDELGIKFSNAPSNQPMLIAPAGQLLSTPQITGISIASRSINSQHIKNYSLQPDDFGISLINNVTSQLA